MPNSRQVPNSKFLEVKNISEAEAEIYIYGEIVSTAPLNWRTDEPLSGYVAQDAFLEEIKTLKDKKSLTIRINSVGGDMFVGLSMYSLLKSLSAKKTVIIDGLAASAASLVAMAGDTIKIPVGAMIMIHKAAVGLCGYFNSAELLPLANTLDIMNKSIADHYAARTGLDTEELLEMMDTETWLGGNDAVEKGFADELLYTDMALVMSADKQTICSNGIEMMLQGIKNMPEIPVRNTKREMESRLKQAGFSNKEAITIASIYGNMQGDPATLPLSESDTNKELLSVIETMTKKIKGEI